MQDSAVLVDPPVHRVVVRNIGGELHDGARRGSVVGRREGGEDRCSRGEIGSNGLDNAKMMEIMGNTENKTGCVQLQAYREHSTAALENDMEKNKKIVSKGGRNGRTYLEVVAQMSLEHVHLGGIVVLALPVQKLHK